MSVVLIGELSLADINIALSGSIAAIIPLLAQVDLLLAGSFGLGPLLADLSLQLNAALSFSLSLGLNISNPLEVLEAELQAAISLVASISASLSLGLPQISVQLTADISASASLSAALALQVGGISALIDATLAVKLPIVSLVAGLQLTAEAVLLSVGFDSPTTLAESGVLYQALTTGPLGTINPGDQVWGVIILVSSSASADVLSTIVLTS